ncbi:MAG: SAM-dependent methyltransferase [Deltaproteobacteria bacterium]|nr:MAG: SAM-dependent methyltransferase [Deltaproteobacteria bacterium]
MKDLTPLENRLRKVARHRHRWARREGIDAYRLYDWDIPEFRCTVDWYAGHVVVTTFPTRRAERQRRELDPPALRMAAARALAVAPERVHLKRKVPQKWGRTQYEKQAARGERVVVHEYGAKLWVNLSDYVDTGLFLDHRSTRRRVRAEAEGKDVLNLFAYTGAFTVHAALGGARSTTSVDLSNTYLGWLEDNLELNGIRGSEHLCLRSDVTRWVRQVRGERWDLAIVDPPSWSASKKMVTDFEIQRDHVDLLQAVRRLIRPGGILYFSTHLRTFRLDPRAVAGARVERLSPGSLPPDFRQRDLHHCFRIEV